LPVGNDIIGSCESQALCTLFSVLQRHIRPSPTEPGQPALQGLLNRFLKLIIFYI